MMFLSLQIRLVWWCQKLRFFLLMVVLGLIPLELVQCLIPPYDREQVEVQKLLIVQLIMMQM